MKTTKENLVIVVDHVSKDFVLPQEKVTTIKSMFTGITRRTSRKKMTKQHALKDISFEVKKGEFFGIVGRNGSGKSTLLKILAGIYQPTQGKVHTYGKLVPFIELGVGFNPELTGRENVYLNGAMLGFSENKVDEMYDSIVEFAELGQFMDQKLKNYSSGMQVRLAFSMAIRADADILLIDEVLAVGDADFQRKCFRYFNYLKKNKKTVVFVSHDMDAVREYCTRAVLVDNSELVKTGSADTIATEYLQIMNSDTDQSPSEGSVTGWGTGVCKISDTRCGVDESKILIEYTVRAVEDCPDPYYGFRIRSDTGQEVYGSNTGIEGLPKKPLKRGENKKISWRIENVLGDGVYLIDVAVVYEGGRTIAEWIDEAAVVTVRRLRHSAFMIQPETQFSIEEIK